MMGKKSILFVNGHLNVGGVEKALVDLLFWFDYDKYDVDLLLIQGRGDYENRLPANVRIIECDTRLQEGSILKSLLKNLIRFRLRSVCYRMVQFVASKIGGHVFKLLHYILPIRSRYDIAISFRPDHCAEIVAYASNAKKKYCWWHHGAVDLSEEQIHNIRCLWDNFNQIVTVSEGCKIMLQDRFGLKQDRITVIPNLIDIDYIESLAGSISPYDKEIRTILVSLSRLSPEKHIDNAIVAAKFLIDRGVTNFVWYIIGDGDCIGVIKELINSNGLNEHFVITGKLVNPYPYLKYADLFVHPSYVESQGIAVLEAMSLAVPVVATKSSGTESFMIGGNNGLLVDRGGAALAEGVFTLLNMDKSQLEIITSNARSTVKGIYAPRSVMDAVERLINER